MSSTKRSLEDTNIETNGSEKKTKLQDDNIIETRLLVSNYESAVIIGKGGSNVRSVREQSGAWVSILKAEGPSKERVMNVKGVAENVAKALFHMAEILIADQASKEAKNQEGVPQPDLTNLTHSFKILFHKFLAGAVIGKGGAIIKEIQTDTGARMQVSNEPLPHCTEKTVSITGDAAALHAACLRVIVQLRDNPLRAGCSTILYIPGQSPYLASIYGQQTPYGSAPQGRQYSMQQPSYGQPQHPPNPMYGQPPQQPMYGQPQQGAGNKTEKIVIPTVTAGSVIGKGGSIIADIKAQSGTQISIADPTPNAMDDRIVTITGTPQGIQTAVYFIRQRVEAYQPPNEVPQTSGYQQPLQPTM